MYQEILNQIGLTKEQAFVYQTLLKNGLMVASKIANMAGIKRSLCYKILDQLLTIGLVEKREDIGKIIMFRATHPSKLKDLLAKKEEAFKTAEATLGGTLGKMISDYNLVSGKPNVQFFEGLDGVNKVLADSLTATETIDAYSDIESIEKYIPEINKAYVEKRKKLNIKKRGLILDTPKARELLKDYHPEITENRFIKCSLAPSQTQTILQIYDNKISYITLGENNLYIGMIIESPNIYSLQKYLYQSLWELAEKDEQVQAPPPVAPQ